ncbi:MAG: flagellar biosynthetic protein FliO [Selenomonadaceae bacterium]|nr:flagellar biosynthetic protein FliO [Selenomonadaceae bacterium]
MKNIIRIFLAVGILLLQTDSSVLWAAEEAAPSSGYLANYNDVNPMPTSASWFSTLAYLISLLAVFAIVLLMAYGATRFIGGRFSSFNSNGAGRLIASVALGPKMSVAVVEVAGQMLILGVTEHNVSLLAEVIDPEEIDRLERVALTNNMPTGAFSEQFGALSKVIGKIPPIFKNRGGV